MKQLIILIFLFLQLIPCFSQKGTNASCEVRHVTSKLMIDGRQMFYALPKNIIEIKVVIKKTTQFEGPYSNYAQKYLNITEGVIQMDDEFYTIETVKFDRTSIPDSSRFYSLSYIGYDGLPLLQLNPDGILIGCNVNKTVQGYSTINSPILISEPQTEEFKFTDLGVKPFLVEKKETLYKTVQTDSTTLKVPYTKTKMVSTSDDFNADEIAALIRKIRKRRMKLVMGYKDETFAVDGKSMVKMVEELDELEQMYIELFMGKTIEKTHTYSFSYEPDEDSNAEQKIVGWFSPSKGLNVSKPNIRRSDYQPLVLKSQVIGKVPDSEIKVMNNTQKTPVAIKYGLYYRIPGRIDVSLHVFDKKLASQQWEIAQKGRVIPLPVDYLNDQKYSIEFYPETGALKRISFNNFD